MCRYLGHVLYAALVLTAHFAMKGAQYMSGVLGCDTLTVQALARHLTQVILLYVSPHPCTAWQQALVSAKQHGGKDDPAWEVMELTDERL